jgi:catechol 2,3-dioxygenase-like lactoylglutathione lyase family enzyme
VEFVAATPVLASLDIARSVAFFTTHLGFTRVHVEPGVYGIVARDAVRVHFWACEDRRIAEATACRIQVTGIRDLYERCKDRSVVHPDAPLAERPWGSHEFAILDPDGNLVTFHESIVTAGVPATDPHAAARRFFDDFVVAFRTFDGNRIAERYLAPYLAMRADGSAAVFASGVETGRYFQSVLDDYRARGCRACRYHGLTTAAIGPAAVVATVTWELLSAGDAVVSTWRESYNLWLVDGAFKVYASTDHE